MPGAPSRVSGVDRFGRLTAPARPWAAERALALARDAQTLSGALSGPSSSPSPSRHPAPHPCCRRCPKRARQARADFDAHANLCACPSCGLVFADEAALLAHRPHGHCLTPADAGLTLHDRPCPCWAQPKETP